MTRKQAIIPILVQGSKPITQGVALKTLPPLSLYIHFPWCEKKCPYCDFNSHAIQSDQPNGFDEKQYLDALCRDLEESLHLVWGRRIHSIFIGGGTPSLLSAEGLDRLLADIRARIGMDSDIEITMEANPGSVEAAKFAAYAASGVNRISLGIQSLNDTHLKALGRVHSRAEAIAAIAIAKKYFAKINLDIMYGLPNQTLAEAIADLDTALQFDTSHISLYHLTLEPNTLFAKFPPPIPHEDIADEMQEALISRLAQHDYHRYEISAYAKGKATCFHNLNYWTFGDYLGIGAGAHGKISSHLGILRTMKERHPTQYMTSVFSPAKGLIEERMVSRDEVVFEYMLNTLRLTAGASVDLFEERTGVQQIEIQAQIDLAIRKGLLAPDPVVLRATPLGLQFLNNLQELFLPENTS
jgi:putative oxygen-independent coproporphyrinogen III oxidase